MRRKGYCYLDDYRFFHVYNNAKLVKLTKVYQTSNGMKLGGEVGLPISYTTFIKHTKTGQDAFIERLLRFTPEEWEAFVMVESIGE